MINLAKNSNFTSSLIRNSLVQLFWWVIFFPGFFSADSFAAVNMARSGELTNSYTASWALYVRIFSFHGNAIWLLTLINAIILVYSLTAFSYSVFKQSTAAISSFLLTLTPLVWAMGITLWHDILMTAGLLLLVTFYTNILKNDNFLKSQSIFHLFLGSILVTFRPNGLPTIIVFTLLVLIYYRKVQIIKYASASLLVSSTIALLTSYIILGLSPINSYFAQEWMRNDISCFAFSESGSGFVEKTIPKIGNTDSWKSLSSCTFLNDSKISDQDKVRAQTYIPAAWLELFRDETIFVLNTHLQRNAYLNVLPLSGIPRPPFMHSVIDPVDSQIKWSFPELAEQARKYIRAWNASRGFFAWAGFWFFLQLVLMLFFKQKILIITNIMNFSLTSILFIVAPIPDARYALYVLISGQLLAIGFIFQIMKNKDAST